MSRIKSQFALLLALAALTFSTHTVSAQEIPIQRGSSDINSVTGQIISAEVVKNVMIARRDVVVAEKMQSKPLLNEMMPKIGAIMMPFVKAKILPEKMAGLQNEMAQNQVFLRIPV